MHTIPLPRLRTIRGSWETTRRPRRRYPTNGLFCGSRRTSREYRFTSTMQGWEGWDEYAAFYDWENAQTLGRRDVPFWCELARRSLADRPVRRRRLLEL